MTSLPAFLSSPNRLPTGVQPRPALCRPWRPATQKSAKAAKTTMIARNSVPIRVGHGFDLHRLEPGLPLILGGVTLKHDRGCAGHSDGDAVYHCVVDAVLGALSLPDIGQLFPDTDPQFKDCQSHVFMSAAYDHMRREGFHIGNVDVTVILERPKMSPHKDAMRKNIADLLCTPVENVNLKAKTNEKVDAVGENRAVSVHAVATLVRDDDRDDGDSTVTGATAMGTAVTNSLLGMVGKRVADVQAMTGPPFLSSSSPAASSGDAGTSCAVQRLYNTVVSRRGADADSSWTAKLFAKGRKKIAEKVGEEAVEVVIDAVDDDREAVVKESADLLYHLNVLWADMGITPDDVFDELRRREGVSGVAEKAARKE